MGDLFAVRGQHDDALPHRRAAMEIHRRLAADDASDVRRQLDFADALTALGDTYLAGGLAAEWMATSTETAALVQRVASEHPGDASGQHHLGLSYLRAGALLRLSENEEGAQSLLQRAVQHLERAADLAPGHTGWQADLETVRGLLVNPPPSMQR
jgi:TPR repeat protein